MTTSGIASVLRRSAVLTVGLAVASTYLIDTASAQSQSRPSWCKAERGDRWVRDSNGRWHCENPHMDAMCLERDDDTLFWNVREQKCEECFLTTACCNLIGLPDDCWELRTLRAFRDDYLMHRPGGPAEVALYYDTAPAVLEAIAAHPAARRELSVLYALWVLPAAVLIRLGLRSLAHRHYRRMMTTLLARHLGSAVPAAA